MYRSSEERIVVGFGELRDLIQEEFAKAIDKIVNKNTEPKPLSIEDVVKRYNVSKVTVNNWIKKGKIKGFKMGKRRFFHLRELEDCYVINAKHHDALVEKGLAEPYRKPY